uniref:Uncharacterized protein n=1 Tax=Zea mays TaxID=4577 RepID=B6TSZ0_MAIZE|nr:hypothetical protein [Zea mays]
MDRRPALAVSPRRLRPRPPLVPASSVQTPPGSMKKAAAPMRASVCAIPSPVRFEPSPMRASISALPSPIRAEPSPMRARVTAALQPPSRVKPDLAASSPPPARAAADKENFLLAAAPSSPSARVGFDKENLLPAGADAHDELVALNLAAIARTAGTPSGGPLFVRGRLYDLYSARRNERLKRKQGFPFYSEEFASAAVDPETMAENPCVAVELSKRRVAKKAYAASGAESVRRSMPAVDFAACRGGDLGPRSSLRSSKEMKKASAASGAVSMATKVRRVNPRSSVRRF